MKIPSQILLLRNLRNLSEMVSSLLLSAQMQLKRRDDEKNPYFSRHRRREGLRPPSGER